MAVPLTLRVYRGAELVATREFHRDIIKIGRLATAHLSVDDPRVSRIHAVIEVGAGGFAVIDMGSVEGTFVNGRRISKATLSSGDSIVVGDTRIELLVGEASMHEAPPAPAEVVTSAPAAAAGGAPAPVPLAVAGASAPAPVAASGAPAKAVAAGDDLPAPAAGAAPPEGSAAGSGATTPPAPGTPACDPAEVGTGATPGPEPLLAQAPGTIGHESRAAGTAQAGASGRLPRGFSRPIPWPRDAVGHDLALDLRFFWGDKQLGAGSFSDDELVTVGDDEAASFILEAGNLPKQPFPLAARVDGSWQLRFGPSMDGELIRDGKVEKLAELVRLRKARPVGEGGLMEVEIPEDGAAWVDLGNIRAELCFRPKTKPIVIPLAQRVDYAFMNLFLVVFALFAGGIIAFSNAPKGVDVTADDLFTNQARLTRLLLMPPEPRQNPFLERLKLQAPDGETVKAPNTEGKMGKSDAPERATRSAPRAIKPDDKEIVKNQGILAMLGSGSNSGLSTIFGKEGLGGDLKGAIGGITGAVGDAHGFGGLGLKGTGLGGGGVGTTVGVGAIGTKGRGGGVGDYGKGAGGLGKKASSEVTIDTSSVLVVGYDRELVRRVVQSHHSQLRYCFENELIRNPKLGGRVLVKWVITGDGSVSNASVAATTMNNSKAESCMVSRVRSWKFPPPKGGGIASISYPFVFRSAGD